MSSIANKTCDTCKRRYPVDTLTAKTRNVRSGRSTGGSIGKSGVRLSGRDYWRVQTYYVCTSSERCLDPVGYTERVRAVAASRAKQALIDKKMKDFLRPFVSPNGELTPNFFLRKKSALTTHQDAKAQREVARQVTKELETGISESWENHRTSFMDQLRQSLLDNLDAVTVSELEALYSVIAPANIREDLEAALRMDEDAISASVLDRIAQSNLDFSGDSPTPALRATCTSQKARKLVEHHSRLRILSFKNFAIGTIGAFSVIVIAVATELPSVGVPVFFAWLGYALFTWLSRLNTKIGRRRDMKQLSSACAKFYEVETWEVDSLLAEQFESWISQYEVGLLATRLMSSMAESQVDDSEAVVGLLGALESGSRKKRLSLV